ncbi:MAG: aspartate racemase [Caulobacter sp.]|nr:aspartate racemase [Caulobacter sp.]
MTKILGVLGGMGPAATLDFLAKLQAATPAARDQDHIRVLVDINPQVPDRNEGDDAPGPVLAAMATGLRNGGAQVLAIACNTAHAYADAVQTASGLPLIDLIETAAQAAKATGATKAGVLATGLAIGLYRDRLAEQGIEALILDTESQAEFMGLLYRIKAGDRSQAVQDQMSNLADRLVVAGAKAVIAGCTEVPLVLEERDLDVPFIDAGAALARRCVEVCLG